MAPVGFEGIVIRLLLFITNRLWSTKFEHILLSQSKKRSVRFKIVADLCANDKAGMMIDKQARNCSDCIP